MLKDLERKMESKNLTYTNAIILLGHMEDEKQKELREYEDELYKNKD